ncbi:MAG: hypothetical protein AMJ65_03880 [Phycisphaerae bacterium SG8_4]|nr:MAG: hypothetical protein AMJ65_03880 [Phycisphaerae bacterium SG8_4]
MPLKYRITDYSRLPGSIRPAHFVTNWMGPIIVVALTVHNLYRKLNVFGIDRMLLVVYTSLNDEV